MAEFITILATRPLACFGIFVAAILVLIWLGDHVDDILV